MTSLHVSFVNLPITAAVNSELSLVAAMVRRGYRVSYVTSPQFESKVAALGAEVICCPELDLAEAVKSIALIKADQKNDGDE